MGLGAIGSWIFKKLFARQVGKQLAKQAVKKASVKMSAQISDDIIGGSFKYADGKITEFLANHKVIGNKIEFTDMAFYPKGAVGNELKNAFGNEAILGTFQAIKKYAKSKGFNQVRIHFQRAAKSSSAKPGKIFDQTFNL